MLTARRMIALFLLFVIVVGSIAPVVSAAPLYRPDPSNPHIKTAKVVKKIKDVRIRSAVVVGEAGGQYVVQKVANTSYNRAYDATQRILGVTVANTGSVQLTVVMSSFRGSIAVR